VCFFVLIFDVPLLLYYLKHYGDHYFQITLGAGLGLIGYAALAGGDAWKEFSQYFRTSKFVCLLYLNWL
jgi:hypothetical protein